MGKAIILVGGEGTRLRPLTYTRPKPMLPVAGVSILERKLAHMASHGITEAVLSLGYKPDAFIQAFPSGEACGVKLHYAVEPSPLDTAGAIKFAAGDAGWLGLDEPIVVVNGDVLTELDLTAQIAQHATTGAEATLALTQVEDPSAFGVVPTDADGRVVAFVEKPPRDEAPTDWINGGTYILNPSVFARIPDGRKVSIERETFPLIAATGGLFAIQSGAYWLDAGTPALYLQANTDWLDRHHNGASVVGKNAVVAANATIVRSVIGDGVTIGAGAHLVDAVLLPGVTVGANAVVKHSLIGSDVVIGKRAEIVEMTVLGDGVEVDPTSILRGERVCVSAQPK
jgi:mannose-1-phosphate guanylyltransferase